MIDPKDFKTDPAEHDVPDFDLSIEADRRALVFWWNRAMTGTLAEQGAMVKCLDAHIGSRPAKPGGSWLTGLRERLWVVYAERCEELEHHG